MKVHLGDIVVRLPKGDMVRGGEVVETLTELEAALLHYMAERPGEDISRSQLHREVWGYAEGVRSRAVDFTMSRLRRKIEPDGSAPRFLHTVRGAGYRFDPQPDEAPPPSTVMPPPDAFLGRDAEMARLVDLMASDARLITLLGFGGVGKTRLALEFLAHHHDGDAAFADLSSAATESGVLEAVARGLGIPPQGSGLAKAVQEVLRTRKPLLLLDDVETVVAPVSHWVRQWLAHSDVRIVLTSRESLRIAGEHVIDVGPLHTEAAVRMLRARAEAQRGPLSTTEDTLRALVDRLDGWPLAIELAAARTRIVTPEALLARLDPLRLSARRRDLPERQRSIRAVLEDTWGQLSVEEKQTLVAVALLPQGASIDALESLLEDRDVIDATADLADRALVRIEEVGGQARARMVGIVASWARAHSSWPELVDRRLSWAVEHAEAIAEHLRWGHTWRQELDHEAATVRGIWEERGPPTERSVRLGVALFWWRCQRSTWLGLIDLARAVHADALVLADEGLERSARLALAYACRQMGEYAQAVELVTPITERDPAHWETREAIHILGTLQRRLGEREQAERTLSRLLDQPDVFAARALIALVHVHANRADNDKAIRAAREAEALFHESQAPAFAALAAINLCFVLRSAGRLSEAREAVERAARTQQESGRAILRVQILHERYAVATYAGDLDAGEAHALEELALRRSHGDRIGAAWALGNLGLLAAERGDFELALERLQRASEEHTETGSGAGVAATSANFGIVALLQHDSETAVQYLDTALENAESSGLARFVPVLRAFRDVASGQWHGAPPSGPPQDMRILERVAVMYGLIEPSV